MSSRVVSRRGASRASWPRPVEDYTLADDLHQLSARFIGDFVTCVRRFLARFAQHADLDKLVRLKVLVDLLQNAFGHAFLADHDARLQVVRHAAQLTDLLAGDSHGLRSFLFVC